MKYSTCPRCNSRSYEKLKTYGHCVECSYSQDDDNYLTLIRVPINLPGQKMITLGVDRYCGAAGMDE